MTELHPIARARERLGVEWSIADLRRVVAMINDGKSLMLNRVDAGNERHALRIDGRDVVVVFNRAKQCVMTVLPTSSALNHRKALTAKKRARHLSSKGKP